MVEQVLCPLCSSDLSAVESLELRTEHVEQCMVASDARLASIEQARENGTEANQDGEPEDATEMVNAPSDSDSVICVDENEENGPEESDGDRKDVASPIVVQTVDVHTRSASLKRVISSVEERPAKRVEVATSVRAEKRSCPWYKLVQIDHRKIGVDAFSYGPIAGVDTFFLTHFHSDHYGGLSKSWAHGIIYCSGSTSRLIQRHLKVNPDYIREIELDEWTNVDGIDVLFLDANHCPGSVIIAFRDSGGRTIVHTGDFRACETHVDQLQKYLGNCPIDLVYLDTTYLDPSHCFPSQTSVTTTCAKYCQRLRDDGIVTSGPSILKFFGAQANREAYRPLVLVGTYTIGKERLAVEIAKALDTKIFAGRSKKDTILTIGDQSLTDMMTDDGWNSAVHLVSMRDVTFERMEEYFRPLKKRFTHLVAFVPTGWTYHASKKEIAEVELEPKARPFGIPDLEKSRQIRGRMQLFRVPYSEHSSFVELKHFCTSLPVRKFIPTVMGNKQMDYWLQKWTR
uniref:ARAD1B15378p n=1 Tax=Blastobotrys adeninivorans TaxID=409370 RepID=A0A060T5Y6_BLAAD